MDSVVKVARCTGILGPILNHNLLQLLLLLLVRLLLHRAHEVAPHETGVVHARGHHLLQAHSKLPVGHLVLTPAELGEDRLHGLIGQLGLLGSHETGGPEGHIELEPGQLLCKRLLCDGLSFLAEDAAPLGDVLPPVLKPHLPVCGDPLGPRRLEDIKRIPPLTIVTPAVAASPCRGVPKEQLLAKSPEHLDILDLLHSHPQPAGLRLARRHDPPCMVRGGATHRRWGEPAALGE
mmetsp:Transcript_9477/g.24781  ORF Transcript_9477/g.24781 Transcript_9477/m.24781 type:complete len:235 (-) Transcript_9477:104-808(-)